MRAKSNRNVLGLDKIKTLMDFKGLKEYQGKAF